MAGEDSGSEGTMSEIEELIDAVIWAAWFDENSLRKEEKYER